MATTPEVLILPDGRMDRKNAATYLGNAPKTLAQYASKGVGTPLYQARPRLVLQRRPGRLDRRRQGIQHGGRAPGGGDYLMNANEKAAGVLDTPATAQENVHRDSTQKRFANLQANAVQAGITLLADSTPRYLVSRWGLSSELPDLDSAARWLARTTRARA